MFIQVTGVDKTYHSGGKPFHALKQVGLELEKGDVGVILGPSGSGKSTLLNILGGIDAADNGIVRVAQTDITKLSQDELTNYRRDQVGFVFQFYNLIPHLTVEENVEVTAHVSDSPLDMREMLEAVGMYEFRTRFPRELSGGQQQRVSIARALIKNPDLLLCDEPTGALDYATSKDILKLIEDINRAYGTTVLMITHNHAIADMARKVYRMRSGEIVEALTNETIVPAERIEW